MTELDGWLKQATRHLAKDSAARVRVEIQDHYESARDAAIGSGVAAGEADRLAVAALGDAGAANRQYRKVLLTSLEARMLREGNCEARAFGALRRVKWLFWAVPAAVLLGAGYAFFLGARALAGALLASCLGMGILAVLPIDTLLRGRIFRCLKWVVVLGIFAVAFGHDLLKWSWLMASSLWPLVWTEWTRASIRRKLRREAWPRHLYY